MKVLYLEDEKVIGRIVKESLESRGCRIDWFASGTAARAALEGAGAYDIAVLDVQLPGESGFVLGKGLRQRFPALPILFLTARVEAKDAVAGFAAGGNDYLRKPFSMEELLVRMRNLVEMRSGNGFSPALPAQRATEMYVLGSLRFDYQALTLRGPRTQITLSHREAELLRYLLDHRHLDQIDRRNILQDLWGDDGFFHSRNLDVYIRKLRQHLAADKTVQILTLRGVGYRLLLPPHATET